MASYCRGIRLVNSLLFLCSLRKCVIFSEADPASIETLEVILSSQTNFGEDTAVVADDERKVNVRVVRPLPGTILSSRIYQATCFLSSFPV